MAARKIKVSIAIDPHLVKRVDRLAKMAGLSRSQALTDLVGDAIDSQEQVIKAATDPVLMNAIAKVISEPGMMRAMFSGLREELSQDQLDLFACHMQTVRQNMKPVAQVLEEQQRAKKSRVKT